MRYAEAGLPGEQSDDGQLVSEETEDISETGRENVKSRIQCKPRTRPDRRRIDASALLHGKTQRG